MYNYVVVFQQLLQQICKRSYREVKTSMEGITRLSENEPVLFIN